MNYVNSSMWADMWIWPAAALLAAALLAAAIHRTTRKVKIRSDNDRPPKRTESGNTP